MAPDNSAVRDYWNEHIHDLEITRHPVGSPGFFSDLDQYHFEKLHHLPRLVDFDGYRGQRVLEVGCGAGTDLVRFAKGGADVTGVDLSASAITLARENFRQQGLAADLREADGEHLPFPDESFDFVYAHAIIVRMPRFYLTTAIDYVNSRPHLGTAYEKITADVIARYQRLRGAETHFVMGNDEHSQNVYRRAREEGFGPLEYCDRMEQAFRSVWDRLDVSYDDFIRTTQPRHRAAVQELVRRIRAAGDVYEGTYEGWYCVGCEAFKQEKDLVDGKCPLHGVVEWITEKNHFFRLSAYRDKLLQHFEAHPEFLEPDVRRNEILRLLDSGLDDISISRAGQHWGIPVPDDPDSVVYVWFDALINYASAVGLATDNAQFERWWPADLHEHRRPRGVAGGSADRKSARSRLRRPVFADGGSARAARGDAEGATL